MRKNIFRILLLSIATSLCLALNATDIFAQCGADGTQPCNTTPKKPTPKKKTPKSTVSKPITPIKKPQTNVVKPKSQPKFVPRAPSIEMVKIPAGSFMMGSDNGRDNEKPVHKVIISREFWMGKYEVTQAQWKAVMGNNPSYFKGDNLPVERVSWDDVKDFIRKLNNLQNNYEYRLPTEAEWEYAARAGTTGDYAGNLDSMAWYYKNSDSKTHAVATKQANGWGLYDMHGNVWEWCQDWYGSDYYANSASVNPTGASVSVTPAGETRVFRGGGWNYFAEDLRSANRGSGLPSYRIMGDGYVSPPYFSHNLGFRLVRQ